MYRYRELALRLAELTLLPAGQGSRLGVVWRREGGLVLLDTFFQSTAANIEIGIGIVLRPFSTPRNDVLRRSLAGLLGLLRLAPPHPVWLRRVLT
jgi:hypothetical protein